MVLGKSSSLLETKGYKVITLDLPSHGNDTAQLANVTLDDDVKKVTDAANAIKGKVILIGHSSGGVVISQAAELLGAGKIDKLIYLDAFLPQNGESVFSLAGKIRESNNASSTSQLNKQQPELLIFSEDKKSCKWNPELVEQIFYHDCSPKDIAFAKAHLSWQSFATLQHLVHVTDSIYQQEKYYIPLYTGKKI
jgi:pimeloyl-ACP methyl ester carboxylesterase